jgi:hypothetical protein
MLEQTEPSVIGAKLAEKQTVMEHVLCFHE